MKIGLRSIRVPFIVAVVLTLAPMQAWAECAWVLWAERARELDPRTLRVAYDYDILVATTTAEACYSALRAQARDPNDPKWTFHSREAATLTTSDGKMVFFRCLPDTIDPRGPKGGGG